MEEGFIEIVSTYSKRCDELRQKNEELSEDLTVLSGYVTGLEKRYGLSIKERTELKEENSRLREALDVETMA